MLHTAEELRIYKLWDVGLRYHEQEAPYSTVAVTDPRRFHVPVYFCPSRRSPSGLGFSSGDPGTSLPGNFNRPGGRSDYAISGGTNTGSNLGGAIIAAVVRSAALANGQPYTGSITNGAFFLSPAGTRATSFASQTSLPSISDGSSNTLLVGEKHVRPDQLQNGTGEDRSVFSGGSVNAFRRLTGLQSNQTPPPQRWLIADKNDITGTAPTSFGSWHPGVCQFVFCDGSVKAISVSVDMGSTTLPILTALGLRDDGQPIPPY